MKDGGGTMEDIYYDEDIKENLIDEFILRAIVKKYGEEEGQKFWKYSSAIKGYDGFSKNTLCLAIEIAFEVGQRNAHIPADIAKLAKVAIVWTDSNRRIDRNDVEHYKLLNDIFDAARRITPESEAMIEKALAEVKHDH